MNAFQSVSLDKKTFKRDFTDTVKTVNELGYTRTDVVAEGFSPVKFYRCNGETYAYCTDKNIRKTVGNGFTSVNFTSDVIPLILAVTVGGAKKVMFVSDLTSEIDGETVSGIPYGAAGAFCGGRLFIADGYKLRYSGEFDFTDFSVGLDFGGFIEVDKDAGEILYLSESGGELYVVCEHAAFTLSPYGEPYEFKMEKIVSFGLSVVENTVFGSGGYIGFISGKDFCVLTSGKIKKAGDALGSYPAATAGVAGGVDGLYVLPFEVGASKYAYVYDFTTGKEAAQSVDGYTVAGGYAVKSDDDRLYRVTFGSKTVTATNAYSEKYDFGTCAKKAICRIEAHIRGNCRLTVKGDGTFTSTITENCNSVSCFVHGRSFDITFDMQSADFKLYRLSAQYVIYGE